MTFPPDNPTRGEISFRIEAWPHDPGANGEHYSAGCLPAAEVVRELRHLADRIEQDWAHPECPWPEEHARMTPDRIAARRRGA